MQQMLTIIATAVLTYTFTLAVPYVKNKWNAFKHAKKRRQHTQSNTDISKRIDDLESQIDNLAERLTNRDVNRKSNVRRDVREYLKQLQND